jgi:predicted transcriptional regulator
MSTVFDFDQKRFLKEVRKFMKTNKLSVRAFAKISDVAFSTLYFLEKGKGEIMLTTIRKLQKAMDNHQGDII